MFFRNLCVLVLWPKVASALEGLIHSCLKSQKQAWCPVTFLLYKHALENTGLNAKGKPMAPGQ